MTKREQMTNTAIDKKSISQLAEKEHMGIRKKGANDESKRANDKVHTEQNHSSMLSAVEY